MELSKLELETLLLLADRGPLTGYDLHSKKSEDGSGEDADTNIMSDVYWLKVRKKLIENNLIMDFPEEGRRKPYIIGEDGFDYLIRTHIDKIYDFDNFTKYCKEYFPLVLGYWEELKDRGFDDYVKGSLRRMIEGIYVDVVRELVRRKRETYTHQEFIEDLYARIYIPEMFLDADEAADNIPIYKIHQFRNSKPEIMNFILEWITEEKNKSIQRIMKLEKVEKNIN